MTDPIKRDDAPDQIFASQGDDGWRWPRASKYPEQGPHENIKYVRADLVDPAAIRKAAMLDAGYDTPAIDPAAIREAALREAYDSLFRHPSFNHAISGQNFKVVKLEDAAEGIIALSGETK